MAVGRGVALGSNSIPVPGSPSFREPATSEDELSLGGVVGEDAGSLVRMPHASAAGMTRAANTNVARGADSLCTTRGHLIHQRLSGSLAVLCIRMLIGARHTPKSQRAAAGRPTMDFGTSLSAHGMGAPCDDHYAQNQVWSNTP